MAGIDAGMAGPLDEDEELLPDDGEELEFSLEEIEEAMGSSPLDDLTGREYDADEDGEEATDELDGEEEGAAAKKKPLPPNPRTGQPRREDGTWDGKPDDEGNPAEGADQEDQPEEPADATEAATDPAKAGTDRAGTDATTTERQEAAAEPVRYRSGGKAYEIPGSRVTDEGAFIPKAELATTLQLLNRGRHYETTYQQERQALVAELETVRTARSESEVKFNALWGEIERMLDKAEGGDSGEWYDWLERVAGDYPTLKAKAERAYAEHLREEAEAIRAGTAPGMGSAASQGYGQGYGQPEPEDLSAALGIPAEEIERGVRSMLPKAIELARELPEAMHVSDAAADAAAELIDAGNLWGRIFQVVTRDFPDRGLRKGEVLTEKGALAHILVTIEKNLAAERRTKAEADAAAERNRTKLGARGGQQRGQEGQPHGQQKIPLLPAVNDREAYEQWQQLPLSVREASAKQGRRAPKGKWVRGG